ncbi:hypothetical protein [Qipengyuania sediminis]|uniref:hypothetical protein n=1 Tax=Qipengyuania sediminis TaxID=1532023 RepID=UPI00140523EE|nr:hypothetical protein [Qipengyuania sediminis]
MEAGFLIDSADGGASSVAAWHRGAPDKRWWGLKTRKADQRTITTLRCTSCGFLESYAR